MTRRPAHDRRITLDRDDAEQIAESIRALGSWLNQAPSKVRDDFTRYTFQADPTAPGASWHDFNYALAHSWRALCDTLDDTDTTSVTHMSVTQTQSSWA